MPRVRNKGAQLHISAFESNPDYILSQITDLQGNVSSVLPDLPGFLLFFLHQINDKEVLSTSMMT